MKPSTRRLGRGLGAFLDFGPTGQEPSAYLPIGLDDETKSVLETSTQDPLPAAVTPVPVPAPVPVAAPAPVVRAVAPPVIAPPPPPAPRPPATVAVVPPMAPPPAPPAPQVRRIEPEPVQPRAEVASDSPFVDEIVGGLTFPDVDLS